MGEFHEYKPLHTLSMITIGCLAAQGLLDVAAIILAIAQIVAPGVPVEDIGVSMWMMAQGIVAMLGVLVYLITVVLFLVWLHRAHKNLPALRAEYLQYSPGWAVGWWFIPFANLVMPFKVVREVWAESSPDISEEPSFLSESLHRAPVYVGFWWGLWLAMNFVANITSRLFDSTEPDNVIGYFFIAESTVSIAAVGLAIYLVRDITQRQEKRHAVVGSQPLPEPPPPPSFHPTEQP
jgi:type IV secretory pathway VirB3-like protein